MVTQRQSYLFSKFGRKSNWDSEDWKKVNRDSRRRFSQIKLERAKELGIPASKAHNLPHECIKGFVTSFRRMMVTAPYYDATDYANFFGWTRQRADQLMDKYHPLGNNRPRGMIPDWKYSKKRWAGVEPSDIVSILEEKTSDERMRRSELTNEGLAALRDLHKIFYQKVKKRLGRTPLLKEVAKSLSTSSQQMLYSWGFRYSHRGLSYQEAADEFYATMGATERSFRHNARNRSMGKVA